MLVDSRAQSVHNKVYSTVECMNVKDSVHHVKRVTL